MARSVSTSLRALIADVQFATLELKFDLFVRAFERRYRESQPRAPAGTSDGGQWIADLLNPAGGQQVTDRVHVAGPRCDGFSGGCQFGGTFGTTGMFKIFGRNLCWDCAVKILSIEDLSGAEQLEFIGRLDSIYQQGGTNVIKSASPQSCEGWRSNFWTQGRWPA